MNAIKRWLKKPLVLIIFCIVFVGLAAYQVIYTIQRVRHVHDNPAAEVANDVLVKNNVRKTPVLKAPLFGEYVPQLESSEVKQSMLNFRVVGVLFSTKEENSQVIIETTRGEAHTYKVGEVLPGQITIKRITPKGVVVSHDGGLESLSLPKENLQFQPTPSPLSEDKL